ncbi:MAG: hypothetical protein R2830_14410 [Saprospiraceae bacterium]
MKKIGLILLAGVFLAANLSAQSDTASVRPIRQWLKKNERFVPVFKTMVQLWGIYSRGMEVYDADQKKYERVDDRLNLLLRRARLVVAGEPYANLSYTVVFYYDQIGRDILASGVGGPNKADPGAGIWDAFFQWKITRNESLNLVGGWFRPQMQRESITSGWATNSFEKSMSQNYLRTHLVGTGPGRAMGVTLGGLAGKGKINLNYNLGLFNPVTTALSGASAGEKFALLWTGRLSLSLGDPELKKYGISYDVNYFSQRKGISLDMNASRQGETDLFKNSVAYGPGLLLNWGPLNMDGEWIWMERDGERKLADGQMRSFTSKSGTGHVRAGVNVPAGRFVIEPTFMVMRFSGAMGAEEQADAAAVKNSFGEETTCDAGLNWYLDGKNLKVMIHYTWRYGDPGDAGDGSLANMFFSQSGLGAVRRGDWLGLGVNAIF